MKTLFLLISFALAGVDICQAQYPAIVPPPLEVGIPTNQMNFYASAQHNTQWCWAASIKMVLARYGVNISQERIVRRSYGSDPYGNLPNWAGSLGVITANLNNWDMDEATGQAYVVGCQFGMGSPTGPLLYQELSQGHPVIIGYRNNDTPGHAVVITAIKYYPTPSGPNVVSITVRDPWPSEQNVANQGRVEYNAVELASCITGFWLVRVQR